MAVVEDPRVDRTNPHDLQDTLDPSVLAVLCGADGWEDRFSHQTPRVYKVSWLSRFGRFTIDGISHNCRAILTACSSVRRP
jgi:hypothetical protein